MKYFIYLSVVVSIITSCSKVEDACISNPQEVYFKPFAAEFNSCSSAEYVFWEFGDGAGDQGQFVQHFYSEPGTYQLKQTAYSNDGAETNEESFSIEVGYILVDEVVFSKLLAQGYVEGDDYPTLYLKINDQWSKPSVFSNPPRTFEFDEPVLISEVLYNEVSIVYRDGASDIYIMTESFDPYDSYENPQYYTFSSKFDFDLFWHIGQ